MRLCNDRFGVTPKPDLVYNGVIILLDTALVALNSGRYIYSSSTSSLINVVPRLVYPERFDDE